MHLIRKRSTNPALGQMKIIWGTEEPFFSLFMNTSNNTGSLRCPFVCLQAWKLLGSYSRHGIAWQWPGITPFGSWLRHGKVKYCPHNWQNSEGHTGDWTLHLSVTVWGGKYKRYGFLPDVWSVQTLWRQRQAGTLDQSPGTRSLFCCGQHPTHRATLYYTMLRANAFLISARSQPGSIHLKFTLDASPSNFPSSSGWKQSSQLVFTKPETFERPQSGPSWKDSCSSAVLGCSLTSQPHSTPLTIFMTFSSFPTTITFRKQSGWGTLQVSVNCSVRSYRFRHPFQKLPKKYKQLLDNGVYLQPTSENISSSKSPIRIIKSPTSL